jgi:hypothetical protein
MANLAVNAMALDPAAVSEWLSLGETPQGKRYLFAFTHGRGAWRVQLDQG